MSHSKTYWSAQPCNVNHSTYPKDSIEYSKAVAARRYFVEPHIIDFADFNKWRDKSVLELGCGIGTDALEFARAGAKVTCIDFSQEAIDLAKTRFRLEGLEATFICNPIQDTLKQLNGQQFDLIYSFGVLHHTHHYRYIIRYCKCLLSPCGELRCMLYSTWSFKKLLITLGLDQPEAQSNCPIVHTFNHSQLVDLFKPYSSTTYNKYHIFPYSIPHYKRYEYVKTWLWYILNDKIRNYISTYIGWHWLIVAKK